MSTVLMADVEVVDHTIIRAAESIERMVELAEDRVSEVKRSGLRSGRGGRRNVSCPRPVCYVRYAWDVERSGRFRPGSADGSVEPVSRPGQLLSSSGPASLPARCGPRLGTGNARSDGRRRTPLAESPSGSHRRTARALPDRLPLRQPCSRYIDGEEVCSRRTALPPLARRTGDVRCRGR